VLATDAPQAEYLSQDKKRLVADPVTRWRIADPLKFYKTVGDEAGAGPGSTTWFFPNCAVKWPATHSPA
jgi:regulator of protease activity HflC (stomatin/prohibitin superfamily)